MIGVKVELTTFKMGIALQGQVSSGVFRDYYVEIDAESKHGAIVELSNILSDTPFIEVFSRLDNKLVFIASRKVILFDFME